MKGLVSCVRVCTCEQVNVCLRVSEWARVKMDVSVCVCVDEYLWVHVRVSVCMCECTCVHM